MELRQSDWFNEGEWTSERWMEVWGRVPRRALLLEVLSLQVLPSHSVSSLGLLKQQFFFVLSNRFCVGRPCVLC
jgi:hypothetical protein